MQITQAYERTKEFIEEAEKMNNPVFYFEHLNLLRASFIQINSCILNYFFDSNKPWIKPVGAQGPVVQLAKRWQNLLNKRILRKKNVIFFQVSESNHIKQQYPVALALQKKGYKILFFCGKKKLASQLKNLGFNVMICIPYMGMPTKSSIQLSEVVQSLMSKLSWLDEELAKRITDCIEASYSTANAYLYDMGGAVIDYSPKLIVVGNDILRDGYLSVEIAKQHGVKTAGIMHGFITDQNPLHNNISVDYYFLFGEYFRPYFSDFGFKDENLFVTGVPSFDGVKQSSQQNILAKLNLVGKEKIVLVAFSGPGHSISEATHIHTIEVLHSLIKKFPNTGFVIKLHPKDRKEYYKSIAGRYDNVRVVSDTDKGFENISIIDYIVMSSALISVGSTTIFEAMYLEKPVLSIDLEKRYAQMDYLDSNFVWKAADTDTALSSMSQIFEDDFEAGSKISAAKKFVSNVFWDNDGKASETIANKIIQLIS